MPPLFRNDYSKNIPIELTMFTRSTLENFNSFILALDKVLSENINKKFFEGQIETEWEKEREDGKTIIASKGSISLLDEWLRKNIRWENEADALESIVGPIKEVRKLRQIPAHKLKDNKYNVDYDKQRKDVLERVYFSLMHLRRTMCSHPDAEAIVIPDFLETGRIRCY
jgi:hypothetical protein